MNFLVKILLSAIGVGIASYLLPGVSVDGFWAALVVAGLLALFNVTLKPILIILTIPITVLTLGLFLLVINALLILLIDSLIGGFMVSNFWWALAFSIILTIITSLFEDIAART